MSFSNNPLQDIAKAGTRGDPGFSLVVAFGYYDGPENGIAVFPSGAGVRFGMLGDSRSGRFRAFELAALEGTWAQEAEALKAGSSGRSSSRFLLPSNDDGDIEAFEARVRAAAVTEYFVGVGTAHLDWLSILAIEAGQLQELRALRNSLAAFQAVRRLMKRV